MNMVGSLIGIAIALVVGVTLLPTIVGSIAGGAGLPSSAYTTAANTAYCTAGTVPNGSTQLPGPLYCFAQESAAGFVLVGLLPVIFVAILIIGAIGYLKYRN